jgi:hypothetical protein
MTYSDVMNMPTYERRFFIDSFKREMNRQKEHIEEMKSSGSGNEKGSRQTKVSGTDVKKYG